MSMSARTRHPELAWRFLKKLCYDEEIQACVLQDSQGLPVRRDVLLSGKAPDIFRKQAANVEDMDMATISDVMDEAVMPPKFKSYHAALLYADTEINKIINGTIPFNNSLNKLQKEINAMLQY